MFGFKELTKIYLFLYKILIELCSSYAFSSAFSRKSILLLPLPCQQADGTVQKPTRSRAVCA